MDKLQQVIGRLGETQANVIEIHFKNVPSNNKKSWISFLNCQYFNETSQRYFCSSKVLSLVGLLRLLFLCYSLSTESLFSRSRQATLSGLLSQFARTENESASDGRAMSELPRDETQEPHPLFPS